jgi:hypothetical protein
MTEVEGSSVVGVDPSSGCVVLTYDDGPPGRGPVELTSAILAQVDAQRLRAASLGAVLESSTPALRPWFDQG